MAEKSLTRRSLLTRASHLPLAVLALTALGACAREDKKRMVCVDPAALTATDKSARAESHYVETASDPTKTCQGCKYFEPDEGGGACGKCNIFQGPANAGGHCDSWSPRQA